MNFSFKYYDRNRLIITIVVLTLIISAILDCLKGYIPNWIWMFSPPSAVFLVSLFLILYNKYMWKWKRFLSLTAVPNMIGHYEGKLKSYFDDEERDIVLEVTQTASYIFIRQFTKQKSKKEISKSKSISSDIIFIKDGNPEVLFYYLNDGNMNIKGTATHYGFCKMEYHKLTKEFKGEYFTNRTPQTGGTILVKWVSNKITGDYYG